MAKKFSEFEKELIRQQLKENAKAYLKTFGVKKTSIDDLLKSTNISKGAFYLFYPSKEMLFYEVFIEFHNELHHCVYKKIVAAESSISEKRLASVFFDVFKMVDQSFLSTIMSLGELDYLLRKIPPEILSKNQKGDEDLFSSLAHLIPNIKEGCSEVYAASIRAVFLTMASKKEIGEAYYDDVLKLLLDGLIHEMMNQK